MPGQVRRIQDVHIGHASFTPNPFHQTRYATASPNVMVNKTGAVRIGDITFCTDPAVQGSPNVFVNKIKTHRVGDATGGHQSWVPNAALTGSPNVFVNEPHFPCASGRGIAPTVATTIEQYTTPGGAVGIPISEEGERLGPSTGGGGPVNSGATLVSPEGQEVEKNITEPPAQGDCARESLGSISEKYESNGNPGAIGRDRVGGFSYGSYQIATNVGTMQNFQSFLNNRYPEYGAELESAGGNSAATAGDPAFQNKWKELAQDPGFAKAQKDFIQSTHFDPAERNIRNNTGIHVCERCNGLQDAVWSTAVQHGPGGATRIFSRALARTGKTADTVTDQELIEAIYDERGEANGTKYFGGSTPQVRQSVVNRFAREKQDALDQCRG